MNLFKMLFAMAAGMGNTPMPRQYGTPELPGAAQYENRRRQRTSSTPKTRRAKCIKKARNRKRNKIARRSRQINRRRAS